MENPSTTEAKQREGCRICGELPFSRCFFSLAGIQENIGINCFFGTVQRWKMLCWGDCCSTTEQLGVFIIAMGANLHFGFVFSSTWNNTDPGPAVNTAVIKIIVLSYETKPEWNESSARYCWSVHAHWPHRPWLPLQRLWLTTSILTLTLPQANKYFE